MERKVDFLSKKARPNASSMIFKKESWINFTVLDIGAGYKIKRIEVLPLKQLVYQKNKYHTEHWTVVQGVAKVIINDQIFSVKEGETIDVKIGEMHSIENPDNKEILVFINIQCGSYIREDNLIQFPEDVGKIADAA